MKIGFSGHTDEIKQCVTVVGGVNIDIGGRSFAPLVMKDSNPGHITMSLGGVGRNIAHNLSLLGAEVHLLTAIGDDLYAQRVMASCAEAGIDVRHALQVPGVSTSTYIYLDDADGDMTVAMSDMEICRQISPAYLMKNREVFSQSRLIVVDANIPEESLQWITEQCSVPVFADPVSTQKAQKLRPILSRIHTLKPNQIEAELLSGIRITDEKSLRDAAGALLNTGLKRVVITLGGNGILAADRTGMEFLPACRAVIRNATGAGDAFMAALAWAWMTGDDFHLSCRKASAAAALAVESEETINTALSPEAVYRRMKANTV